jgi:hypothetical protein
MTQRNIIVIVTVIILALVVIKVIGALSRRGPVINGDMLVHELPIPQPEQISVETIPDIEPEELTTQMSVQVEITPAPETSVPSRPSVKQVQTALENAGFNPGKIDGKMGKRTKIAIVKFQKENGLAADGKVGPRTWAELGKFLNITSESANQ